MSAMPVEQASARDAAGIDALLSPEDTQRLKQRSSLMHDASHRLPFAQATLNDRILAGLRKSLRSGETSEPSCSAMSCCCRCCLQPVHGGSTRLRFSIPEIEGACPGISRDMVRVVLRAMKAEGLITPTGKGRAAKWEQTRAAS